MGVEPRGAETGGSVFYKSNIYWYRLSDHTAMKLDSCEILKHRQSSILPTETLLFSVVNAIFIPFALFLNSSIVLHIIFRSRLRSARNALTLNICVVNVFLTLLGRLPFAINLVLRSRPLCQLSRLVGQTTVALSLVALFFLSLERYMRIFYPYRCPYFLTKLRITFAVLFTWVLPLATQSIVLIPGVQSRLVFSILAALNIAVIAFLVAMHCRTIYTLVKIDKEVTSVVSRFTAYKDRRCLIRRSKGVRFLSAATIIVFACYFPLSLLKASQGNRIDRSWIRIHFLAIFLATLPDIVNPICILYTSHLIRSFVVQLPWRSQRKRDVMKLK